MTFKPILAVLTVALLAACAGPTPAPPPTPAALTSTATVRSPASANLQAIFAPKAATQGASGASLSDLQTFLTNLVNYISQVDLPAALADAQAQTPPDVTAAQCYAGLINNVTPSVNQLLALLGAPGSIISGQPNAGGVALAFQKLRDLKNNVGPFTGQVATLVRTIRIQTNLACAPLWVDTNAGFVDPISLFSGT